MTVICENFEWLCYGASPEEVAAMVEDDRYLDVQGPFLDMREYQHSVALPSTLGTADNAQDRLYPAEREFL